jgi:predicted nucleic acid-binding protein
MTTAIDTNVLVALWDKDDALNSAAQTALDAAFAQGMMIISGAVFAELLAFPRRSERFVDEFLTDTGVTVDWSTDESIWRVAGGAFQSYARHRRRRKTSGPRRILADFLIGAHAFQRGYTLLTLDDGIFRSAFPQLRIVRV